MPPYLLHGLAFLTTNLLARVAHPFAFVWLRRIEPANVGRYLSDQFFVDPLNGELCVLYDRDFDLFWNLKQNRMGEAKTQVQIGALNCSLETDPFDLKLLAEALAHALHHVLHERPGQTVQRSRGTRLGRASERDFVVVDFARNVSRQLPAQLSFRSFHRDGTVIVNVDFDSIRDFDRSISDSRHKFLPQVSE